MKKWNLVVDVARCHNSQNCFLSVVDEYAGNEYPGYTAEMPLHGHRWIDILRNERGQAPMVDVAYLPTMCNHCDDAPCMAAAENDAITKRADGIVMIDPEKSKGQKHLVNACPYGAIWWNEELEVPQAWNFDAHLLDRGWKEPRCVQACPTGALRSYLIEDTDMAARVERDSLEVLHPEHGAHPRVYYRNLGQFTKCFIGGSVAGDIAGVEECLSGAVAVLRKGAEKIAEIETDAFGDFKFDFLDADSGEYSVEIMHADFSSTTLNVELAASVYMGLIKLEPR
ncbi:MAG: oxidoreductase [Rhodospirillales bacterium]|nr:oxidoreductase [Rhodospirillales bacterium]